jgi:TatD DNase family protein
MQLVDSHCHLDQLDLAPYEGDLAKALARADQFDVKHFLCVCITLDHFNAVLSIAKDHPNIDASVGLHPNEEVSKEPLAEELIKLAQDKKVVALGETGLDYYRSHGELDWQRERFRQHIRAAKQTKKPLIVHSRQAKNDTLQILQEEGASSVGGVLHCFTEDWAMAKAAIELNFYISFSGIITFKNATEIQAVAKELPLDRMLIETDSPYLAPHPYRGKSNEPAYVRFVAEYIAQLRGVDVTEIADHTTKNYFNLFHQGVYV